VEPEGSLQRTGAGRLPLSLSRSVQSMPPSPLVDIHFNIIFQLAPKSSKWSLLSQVFSPKPCMHLLSPP